MSKHLLNQGSGGYTEVTEWQTQFITRILPKHMHKSISMYHWSFSLVASQLLAFCGKESFLVENVASNKSY
jgi:hypothetical protein